MGTPPTVPEHDPCPGVVSFTEAPSPVDPEAGSLNVLPFAVTDAAKPGFDHVNETRVYPPAWAKHFRTTVPGPLGFAVVAGGGGGAAVVGAFVVAALVVVFGADGAVRVAVAVGSSAGLVAVAAGSVVTEALGCSTGASGPGNGATVTVVSGV